jgi:kynurenine 3-monooxygenase
MAIFLARNGRKVAVYERRPDLRKVDMDAGRSINLALAERGIEALRQAGVYEDVASLLIPMRGRVLHGLHAIAHQVEQHLFDHGTVAQHRRAVRRHGRDHLHRELARLQSDQRHDGIEQVLRRHRLARLLAPAHEVMHAADHLAGTLGLAGDALQGRQQVDGQCSPVGALACPRWSVSVA